MPIPLRRQAVALTSEDIVDRAVCRQKALCMAGRLEAAHLFFSLPRRLVRKFSPVVQALVLAMLDTGHDLLFRCGITLQLVGDQHPWGRGSKSSFFG